MCSSELVPVFELRNPPEPVPRLRYGCIPTPGGGPGACSRDTYGNGKQTFGTGWIIGVWCVVRVTAAVEDPWWKRARVGVRRSRQVAPAAVAVKI